MYFYLILQFVECKLIRRIQHFIISKVYLVNSVLHYDFICFINELTDALAYQTTPLMGILKYIVFDRDYQDFVWTNWNCNFLSFLYPVRSRFKLFYMEMHSFILSKKGSCIDVSNVYFYIIYICQNLFRQVPSCWSFIHSKSMFMGFLLCGWNSCQHFFCFGHTISTVKFY